jgi:CHRD domain
MKLLFKAGMTSVVLAGLLAILSTPAQSQAPESDLILRAKLVSFNQVPSVLSNARGAFESKINEDGAISFALSYVNMSSPVVQAHIHFGASKTNGGVIVFLCGGSKPACPASGTISGTITAGDVSVLPATNGDSVIPQGINPADLGALITAIRSGDTYINVHSTTFPSGEIRGQVEVE